MEETKKIANISKSFLLLSLITIIISFPVCILWGIEFYKKTGNSVFFIVLLLSIVIFIASLGLLKNKQWARILLVTILSLGMIWSVFSTYLTLTTKKVFEVGAINPENLILMTKGISLIVTIIIIAVFGWVIKILLRSPIKS